MSVWLMLSFEPEVPEASAAFETDGKPVASCLSELDQVCKDAGLLPLSRFVDQSEFDYGEEEMDELPDHVRELLMTAKANAEEDDTVAPIEQPFDCSAPLPTITGLIKYLESPPTKKTRALKKLEKEVGDLGDIVSDLKELETALLIAFKAGAKCLLFIG